MYLFVSGADADRQIRSNNNTIFFPSTDAVLLRDVQVLTLYRGRYTTARRSSPVLQLQCAGGSAGCGSYVPEVVQCYNRGSDGIDTQVRVKNCLLHTVTVSELFIILLSLTL